jgi:carbamoylphosphate synthase large subunit
MKIIVTSPRWQAAIACIQSLGRLGHDIFVYDQEDTAPIIASKYCAGFLKSPPEYKKKEYIEALTALIQKSKYDLLIPVSDLALENFSENREFLLPFISLLLPPEELVNLARNKRVTTEHAKRHEIPTPRSWFPASAEEIRVLGENIVYPCVVKLPKGTAGKGVFFANSAEELANLYTKYYSSSNVPFIQEFIIGDLWDVTLICDQGKALISFCFGASQAYLVGGTPPYMFSIVDEELLKLGIKMAKSLNWHGVLDIDFLRSPEGKYYLLEINPRFAGGTNFAYKIGLDFPRCYFDLAFGKAIEHPSKYFRDTTFRTIFPAEIDWFHKHKKSFWGLLTNFAKKKTISDVYWNDLLFLKAQLKDAFKQKKKV